VSGPPDARPQSPLLATLALFGSLTTLVCCALPALLVSIGMGAAMAGLYTAVPQAAVLGQHKEAVFVAAGALILLAGLMVWRGRNAPCPIDPVQAAACARMRKASITLLGAAAAAYAIGGFFAFFAADLLL
jgi:hypothetical protein